MSKFQQSSLPAYDRQNGEGPTLVFLHYWGGSSRTWQPVRERLADWDTFAIDHRGWGRSRSLPGPFSLAQLAEDTIAVLEAAEIEEYVLVGHSMGGKVAQLVASAAPAQLRGLVLVGSGPAKPAAMITSEIPDGAFTRIRLRRVCRRGSRRGAHRDHALGGTRRAGRSRFALQRQR